MNVLVVDDSRAMRKYVKGALKAAEGFEVDEVDSGFEAFRVLARNQYALIITDINMPDINGLELVRFVRKSERHARAKVIVITSQVTDRLRERLVSLGIDGFIAKPFEPETLTEMATRLVLRGEGDDDGVEGT